MGRGTRSRSRTAAPPPETLVTRPPGYMLAVTAPDTIDLQRFERLAADARNADPEHASSLLR